jgi:hypothetical protein
MLVLLTFGWNISHPNPIIQQLIKEVPIALFAIILYLSEFKNLLRSKN